MMKNVNNVLLFTNGDANNANTWSNIPYCFSHALDNKGIAVVCFNYSIFPLFTKLYDHFIRRFLNCITLFKLRFPYLRTTRLFKFFAEKKIKKAILANPQADLCLFMGYGFYNKWNNVPTLLFSDWTTEMDIQKKRRPNFLEKRIIRQESEAINHAEYVISLFPVCCQEMKKKYPKANIHFLGGNVINDVSGIILKDKGQRLKNTSNEIIVEELIERKANSKKLLFIGRKTTYLESAKKLISAYKRLKLEETYKDLELAIVGCSASDFNGLPEGVSCFGFLNKSEEKDRKTYYDLLLSAKLLVNANPNWGAFSSSVEAMYYYTPIIVSPYQDFVKNFGEEIDFGIYNQDFTAESIAKDIKSILNSNKYTEMCIFAHEKVKTYTWDKYVERVLELTTP